MRDLLLRTMTLLTLIVLAVPASGADEDWLGMVRDALEQDSPSEARELLRASGASAEIEEASYLLAETHRLEGELSAAAGKLNESPDGFWSALGYFNLGAGYAQFEGRLSRARVSLSVARAIADAEGTAMAAEVVDHARALEGLIALRSEEYDRALASFGEVRADSYIAPQALYLSGVARARDGSVRRALQHWEQVRNLPVPYPGGPESRLALIWGHAERGHVRQALITSEEVRRELDESIKELTELRERVAAEGPEAVLRDRTASSEDLVEYLQRSRNLASNPILAWFFQFMDTEASQTSDEAHFSEQLLVFLDDQEALLTRFRDRALLHQADLYAQIAMNDSSGYRGAR